MAHKRHQRKFCCSICLDLLKDPVTLPCGHNYCMSCIQNHFDGEDHKKTYNCPQCRHMLTQRPVLVKNTTLADLMEDLQITGVLADHCYAGPGEVPCDFCTGRKLKALKSCLQCLVSYCEQHLQPHYKSPAFHNHKLVDPSTKLQENICSLHNEVMKIFCRTDQKCICFLCYMDEHKGHKTVSAVAERTDRQKDLEVSLQKTQWRIQIREEEVKVLQQEVGAIKESADKAVKDSDKILTELARLIKDKGSDLKQQIKSQQVSEVRRVKGLQKKLEEEIIELKRKEDQLQQLSLTEDHTEFLLKYSSQSELSESDSPTIKRRPLQYFEDVPAAVSEVMDKLKDTLCKEWSKVSLTVSSVDVLVPQEEPETIEEITCKSQLRSTRTVTANHTKEFLNVCFSGGIQE